MTEYTNQTIQVYQSSGEFNKYGEPIASSLLEYSARVQFSENLTDDNSSAVIGITCYMPGVVSCVLEDLLVWNGKRYQVKAIKAPTTLEGSVLYTIIKANPYA